MRVRGGMVLAAGAVALALAGCGGAADAAGGTATASGGAATPGVSEQIAAGGQVYKERCASCHGDSGEGDSAPAVAGAKGLPEAPPAGAKIRTMPFRTAGDVEAFVKARMPITAPGTLTDAQAYAVVAWELKHGGAAPAEPLDATTAATVRVH